MAWGSSWGSSWGASWGDSSSSGGSTGCSWGGSWGDSWGVSWCGGDTPPTGGCFFDGDFFDGGFYCGGVTPSTTTTPTPAGRSTRYGKKRKVMVGDRVYEVEKLADVELILKRMVRSEAEPVTKAAKARIRVVDRVDARLSPEAEIALPVASVEVDWSALWNQLALQDMEFALALQRILMRQEEDDIETLLLLM